MFVLAKIMTLLSMSYIAMNGVLIDLKRGRDSEGRSY
jgi:hypothetical protein